MADARRSRFALAGLLIGAAGLAAASTTAPGCVDDPAGAICVGGATPVAVAFYKWCMSADLACGHDAVTQDTECAKTTEPFGLQDEVIPTVCYTLCNSEHHLMLAGQEGTIPPGSQAEAKYNMIKQELFEYAVDWCEEIAFANNIVFTAPSETDCTEATQDEVPFHASTWEKCYSSAGAAPCPFSEVPGSVCEPAATDDGTGGGEICEDPPNSTGVEIGPELYGLSSWSDAMNCGGSGCDVDVDFAEMLNEHPELVYYDAVGTAFAVAPNGKKGLKLTSVDSDSLAYALGLRQNDYILSVLGIFLTSLAKAEDIRTALGVLHEHGELARVDVQVYQGAGTITRNYSLVDLPSYP